MDFMDVIRKRRSIRRYNPHPVPDDVLHQVLEAARLSPSGGHRQPWHFIVVKDPETKRKLEIAEWATQRRSRDQKGGNPSPKSFITKNSRSMPFWSKRR